MVKNIFQKENNLIKFNKFKVEIIKNEGYEAIRSYSEVLYEGLATTLFITYPSSIVKTGHETLVTDEEYDSIEGVKYYNACFRENDGTIQWRRFAQLGDELGVIPGTQQILKERKSVKKKTKVEKDPFKYKIPDAKQLALKITVNSQHGHWVSNFTNMFKRYCSVYNHDWKRNVNICKI